MKIINFLVMYSLYFSPCLAPIILHFLWLKIFGIVIDGRMCGRKVMESFIFMCNIILFDEYVFEMKREKN